jgi:haloalkane dehalogenase
MEPTPGYLVWRLAMKWRVAVDRALAPLGLTHAQYVLLASLYGMKQPPTQRELADHTGLEALYVSKLARSLDADGLIERVRDTKDTRAIRLTLTDRGREITAPAIKEVNKLLTRLLAPLGGRHDPRTKAFVQDLTTLLDTPLEMLRSPMPEINAIHYEDEGSGTPFVFLHGNPASSHLWRNVLPGVPNARLLTPDLIGMGQSAKPDIAYSFDDHARYLDGWFDALGLERVVMVGHDWGGALAFDWAARHPDRVAGIAFAESIVKPMSWDELSPQARARGERVRGDDGEKLYLDQDQMVRQAFTGAVLTPVSEADLAVYLAPYPTRESRRPLLAWARQMPLGGEPADLVKRIESYDTWLATSPGVPKLLMTFAGSPTLLISETMADWCASHIASLEIVACGQAGHHAPEDRPAEIAAAVSDWADRHGLR